MMKTVVFLKLIYDLFRFFNERIIIKPFPGLLYQELPGLFLRSQPLFYEGDDEGSQPSVLLDVPVLTELSERLDLSSDNKIQHGLVVSEGSCSRL